MPTAGVLRRLASLTYDLLLVLALLFAATALVLPLSGGEAITPAAQGAAAHLYRLYLAALALAYFGYSWIRGGQTVGMMAWKIRIERSDGVRLAWPAALGRFAFGLGLGLCTVTGLWLLRAVSGPGRQIVGALLLTPAIANYAWLLRDRPRGTLQDRCCRSRIVRIVPEAR